MIVLSVLLNVKPGRQAELEAAVSAMLEEVRQEPGTLVYCLHRDQSDPLRYMLYEKYEDEAALDVHMATDSLQVLLRRFEDILENKPVVERFEAVVTVQYPASSGR